MEITFGTPRQELQPYIEPFWVFESPNGFPAADVMHWGEVLGDEPVLNLDVFTPKRPQYAP